MSKKMIALVALLSVISYLSCSGDDPASSDIAPNTTTSSVTDIDGNVYQTVKIGNQWWMAENLKVTRYRNGDHIPHEPDNTEWLSLTSGAYCKYENADSNVAIFGLLYNWYAVDDSRHLAPLGWHIPSDDEWKELEMFLGMDQSVADTVLWRGTDEGGKLKDTGTVFSGTGLWADPNTGATNEFGFTALPAGIREQIDGRYIGKFYNGFFWSSTEYNSVLSFIRKLSNDRADIARYYGYGVNGISVRCVKNQL